MHVQQLNLKNFMRIQKLKTTKNNYLKFSELHIMNFKKSNFALLNFSFKFRHWSHACWSKCRMCFRSSPSHTLPPYCRITLHRWFHLPSLFVLVSSHCGIACSKSITYSFICFFIFSIPLTHYDSTFLFKSS